MTRRHLGLLAAALAALSTLVACGDEATSGSSGSGGLSLAVRPSDPLRAGAPVVWRLDVENGTGDDVVLQLTSSQRGDVVLRSPDGTEAYRWSEGMVFAQALAEVPLAAGEQATFSLEGTLDVEPGSYVLEATVPSDPAPEPVRADVTVAG